MRFVPDSMGINDAYGGIGARGALTSLERQQYRRSQLRYCKKAVKRTYETVMVQKGARCAPSIRPQRAGADSGVRPRAFRAMIFFGFL